MLATMFIVKLRRIVGGTLGLPGGPADADAPSGSVKRGPAERPSSGYSSSSSGSSAPTRSDSGMRMTPDDFFTYSTHLCHRERVSRRSKGAACCQASCSQAGYLLSSRGRLPTIWATRFSPSSNCECNTVCCIHVGGRSRSRHSSHRRPVVWESRCPMRLLDPSPLACG